MSTDTELEHLKFMANKNQYNAKTYHYIARTQATNWLKLYYYYYYYYYSIKSERHDNVIV